MRDNWLPVSAAILVTVAVVIFVLAGPGGPPASCLAASGCDCEAAGPGVVRQPVNAWSALAIVGAGVGLLASRRRGRTPGHGLGYAIVAAGAAAFAAHATLTDWAYRLDGAAVAGLMAAPAAGAWTDDGRPIAAAWAGAAVTAGVTSGRTVGWVAAGSAIVFAAGRWHSKTRGRPGVAAAAAGILGVGAVLRALGDSGAVLCDPASVLQWHAVWHLAAAVGIITAASYLATGDVPGVPTRPLRSGHRLTGGREP